MSRCRSPLACTDSRPAVSATRMPRTRISGRVPSAASSSRRLLPSTYSITMYAVPCAAAMMRCARTMLRVFQLRQNPCLGQKPIQPPPVILHIGRRPGSDASIGATRPPIARQILLDRNPPIERSVPRQIRNAEPARAQRPLDLELLQPRPRHEIVAVVRHFCHPSRQRRAPTTRTRLDTELMPPWIS